MLTNAFTCTGPYAVLIMLGIKRVENRNTMPVPANGRCAVSCSKSFCREEYGNFMQWASRVLSPGDFDRIPSWSDISDWPGAIVGTCNYDSRSRDDFRLSADALEPQQTAWDEGYPFWWDLSGIVCFDRPIPCRGNVGMWRMPHPLALQVASEDLICQTIGQSVKTADDAAGVFRLSVHVVSGNEGFFVLPLDAKKHILSRPILASMGTSSTSTTVIVKDVISEVMRSEADYIVVAHNHPSGDPTPSEDDIDVTKRLVEASRLVDIALLDHIVLGSPTSNSGRGFVSIRNLKIMEF